jgi:hypothetical protein
VSGSTVTRVRFIRGGALKYISTDGDGVGREQSAEDFIAGLGLGGLDNAIDITGGVLIHTGDGVTGGKLEAGSITGRNGLTPAELDIFGTYTSDTSFEKLRIGYSSTDSGYLISQDVGSAGGTAQPIKIGHRNAAGAFTPRLTVGTDGSLTAGGSISLPTYGSVSGNFITYGTFGTSWGFSHANGAPAIKVQGVNIAQGRPLQWMLANDVGIVWHPSETNLSGNTAADAGVFRNGVNSVRISSTIAGTLGELVCGDITASGTATIIPPTTDPGIAGALWNDGGTLAISAG